MPLLVGRDLPGFPLSLGAPEGGGINPPEGSGNPAALHLFLELHSWQRKRKQLSKLRSKVSPHNQQATREGNFGKKQKSDDQLK